MKKISFTVTCLYITLVLGCGKEVKVTETADLSSSNAGQSTNPQIEKKSTKEIHFVEKLVQCAASYEASAISFKLIFKDPNMKEVKLAENLSLNYSEAAKFYARINNIDNAKINKEYIEYLREYRENKSAMPDCHEYYMNNTSDIDEIFILSKNDKLGKLEKKYKYPNNDSFNKDDLSKITEAATQCMGLTLALGPEYKRRDLQSEYQDNNKIFNFFAQISSYSKIIADSLVSPGIEYYSLEQIIRGSYSIRRKAEKYALRYQNGAQDFVLDIHGSTGDELSKKFNECIGFMKSNEVSKLSSLMNSDQTTPDGFNPN